MRRSSFPRHAMPNAGQMRRGIGAFTLALSLVHTSAGCRRGPPMEDRAGERADADWVEKAQATAAASASSLQLPGSFAGRYEFTQGPATLTQTDQQVTIKYPAGHADCVATGKLLVCTWQEATVRGLANLRQIENGRLIGTWGVGKSATGGGTWQLVPVPSDATPTPPTH